MKLTDEQSLDLLDRLNKTEPKDWRRVHWTAASIGWLMHYSATLQISTNGLIQFTHGSQGGEWHGAQTSEEYKKLLAQWVCRVGEAIGKEEEKKQNAEMMKSWRRAMGHLEHKADIKDCCECQDDLVPGAVWPADGNQIQACACGHLPNDEEAASLVVLACNAAFKQDLVDYDYFEDDERPGRKDLCLRFKPTGEEVDRLGTVLLKEMAKAHMKGR